MNKTLVVLDTNVVLDLLHFDDPTARPLRHALDDGRVQCVVTEATLEEWRRVLAYPGFALDSAQQTALFARYQALAFKVDCAAAAAGRPDKGTPLDDGLLSAPGGRPVWSRSPRCSDPDDQKFIELASASGAQALVSKDRAVLKLRRRCAPYFQIVTPAEAVRGLAAASAA